MTDSDATDQTTGADGAATTPDVVCTLDESTRERRRAEMESSFLPLVTDTRELADGYAFTLSDTPEAIRRAADFVAKEAGCCAFATYELEVPPDYDAVTLRVTGPEGTKELYEEGFAGLDDRFAALAT